MAKSKENNTMDVVNDLLGDDLQIEVNEVKETPKVENNNKLDNGIEEMPLQEESEIDRISKLGSICIKPFTDGRSENMGLEKYDMCLFPYTTHKEDIAALEINGVVKFITGLDEFAPSVQSITNPMEKKAEIKKIREVVAYLESTLATNILDIEDKDFWRKVTVVNPQNTKFWNSIVIECGNDPVYLYPMKEPLDMIKLMVIEAGGYPSIAPSYEEALAMAQPPKFYLEKNIVTSSYKTVLKRLKNKAISTLDQMSDKTPTKMLYVIKLLESGGVGYKKTTSQDIIYAALDDFINGKSNERNIDKACNRFIEIASKPVGEVKLRAVIKDAMFYKMIAQHGDGVLYHVESGNMVGRNIAEVYTYMTKPANADIMKRLIEQVEEEWN